MTDAELESQRAPFPRVRGIVATQDTCFGAPRFDGTRIPVETISGLLAGGDPEAAVMFDYGLTRKQITAYHSYMRALMFRNWADVARPQCRRREALEQLTACSEELGL
jgi:uncharacterized protein (DUF433 family)